MLDLGVEIMAGLFFFFLEGEGVFQKVSLPPKTLSSVQSLSICLYQSISTVLFLGMIGKSYQ